MNSKSIYLSAMTGSDGTINPGYLVLFRSGRAVIIVVMSMVAGSFVEMALSPTHTFRVDVLGIAIGAVLGAYGLLLGGLAAYLWGDSHGAPAGTTTTVKEKVTTTEGPQNAAPGAAPADLLADGRGIERLQPKIGPDDVNKSIALVGASKPKRGKRGK